MSRHRRQQRKRARRRREHEATLAAIDWVTALGRATQSFVVAFGAACVRIAEEFRLLAARLRAPKATAAVDHGGECL